MKPLTTLVLIGSLAVNATLAVLVFNAPSTKVAPPAPARPAVPATVAPTIDASVWPKLADSDLPALVARLRAAGFPPAVVRAILAGQIEDSFAARRKALASSAPSSPFWKNAVADPKVQQALMQLQREQQKMLRDLLGRDESADDPLARSNSVQGRMLDFLPPDKAAALRQLFDSFDERRADLLGRFADRDKLVALEKERRDALAAALTPAELFEYDLRNSNTARSLRDTLSAFLPTEAEFRTIYQLRAPFDERFGSANSPIDSMALSTEARREQTEAQKLLLDQIKAALGEPRGSEYERAIDYTYRRTTQLVARLELPPQTADALWAIQKDIEPRYRALFTGTTSRDQLDQARAALYQEAIARLTPLLPTPRALDAYREVGSWLQGMQPRPPPPARK